MSNLLQISIIMNNYFHDVATAMLVSTAVVMVLLYQTLRQNASKERVEFVKTIYRKYTLVAKISFAWILLGGIPRLVFYKQIEWTIAFDNGIVLALMVKHIIMFAFVIVGAVLWQRLGKWLKKI